MSQQCDACAEITRHETTLDERAEALVSRVNDFCCPVRERNKKRWEQFAWFCRLPIVGYFIKIWFRIPRHLEPTPRYFDEDWYRQEGRAIEGEAKTLEAMKKNHMEHWGDEVVEPLGPGDPAGYYTPFRATRRECYKPRDTFEKGWLVTTPRKYDFSSMAGTDKMLDGSFVMCWETNTIVPQAECDWEVGVRTGNKVMYRHRPSRHDAIVTA